MRVKAVLRRTANTQEKGETELTYKGLSINIPQKRTCIDGVETSLTKKEFEILLLLLQNKGRVFSREDILNKVWNDEAYVLDRTIDVNITRLRKKLGEYGKNIVTQKTRLGSRICAFPYGKARVLRWEALAERQPPALLGRVKKII